MKYLAMIILVCSCATMHTIGIKDIKYIAAFDTVCFKEEIIVEKLSDVLYKATCTVNNKTATYLVDGHNITRISK